MFEEKRELSEHSAVEGSTKKLNPNATDWPGCMFGGEKQEISDMQGQGAGVNVKGETFGTCYDTAEVKEEKQDTPEQPVSSNSSLCDESHLLQMINIMQLPKTELMTFNGDTLEFWMFMRSFDSSIGNASIDDSAKLNRLFQYCKGGVLKVTKCCAVMQPSEGYAKARALLKERFGNDYRIS